jgi:hypothetical protein
MGSLISGAKVQAAEAAISMLAPLIRTLTISA